MSQGFNECEFIKLRDKLSDAMVAIARLEEQQLASDRALEIATRTMEAYKAQSNEWRQQNLQDRQMFTTEDKVLRWIEPLTLRVRALEDTKSGFNALWAVAIVLIPVITVLAVHFWK